MRMVDRGDAFQPITEEIRYHLSPNNGIAPKMFGHEVIGVKARIEIPVFCIDGVVPSGLELVDRLQFE